MVRSVLCDTDFLLRSRLSCLPCLQGFVDISRAAVCTSSPSVVTTGLSAWTRPAARGLFENALETVRERYRLAVLAYVAMPEHVHLLLSEPARGDLAKAIQALKLSVAVRSTERPFWQARYFDGNIHDEEAWSEVIRYIHRNPVKRGLAGKPEDWPWSSFRHYATGELGSVQIESFWTASKRGNETLVPVRRTAPSAAASPVSQKRGPGAQKHPRKDEG